MIYMYIYSGKLSRSFTETMNGEAESDFIKKAREALISCLKDSVFSVSCKEVVKRNI